MIVKMTKVQIYGPKELLDPVTKAVYDLGVLHIEQLPPSLTSQAAVRERMVEDKEHIHQRVELETLLDKVRKILILLPRPPAGAKHDASFRTPPAEPEELAKVVDEIFYKINEASGRKKEAQDQLDLLRKYEKMIKNILPVVDSMPETEHLEMVGLTIDKKNEAVLELMEAELGKITGGNFHIFTSDIDPQTVAAVLAFGKSYAPRIKELLWEQNLSELRLPSSLENLPLKEALGNISTQAEKLPQELEKAKQELDLLAVQWYSFLVDTKEKLSGQLEQISTSTTFFKTSYSFIIAGWLPRKMLPKLAAQMEKDYQGQVLLEEVPLTAADKDKIPVHVVNHPFIRPFEVFIRLLPLPIYGTIDPTPFIAFFFPLFFGFIVGDIGYGLITVAVAFFMRAKWKKNPIIRDLGTVLTIAGSYATVFGILFGELFGDLGELYFHMHPVSEKFNRLSPENMIFFLGIAVVVGFIHVFLGISLGIINAIIGGHKKHLAFKIAQFASLLSLSVLIAIIAGVIDHIFLWPTAIILGAGLVVLVITEGFIAPIELLSAMGNILSYARLMAVGLSGVILAFVGNKLGRSSSNVVLGIAIALVFHSINIVLGIFSPTIHSMRLHLVEFFTKFYETGGREYKPFKKHGGE